MKKFVFLAAFTALSLSMAAPVAQAQLKYGATKSSDTSSKAQPGDNDPGSMFVPEMNFGFDEDEEEEDGPKVINQYDTKYKKDLEEDEDKLPALIPSFGYKMAFVRNPGAAP